VPRFLLPGDSFLSRAVVFNQTDAACRVRIRWSSEGALTDNQGEMNFELAAQGEKDVTANLLAQNLVGQGRIRWQAEFIDEAGAILETVHEDLAMPVYPPASYQSKQKISVIKPGQSASFDMAEFTRDTRNTMDITVSANALVRIKDALSYVVGYPYGCVEQTTSRLMPLYLLRKNEALLDTTLADTRIDEYLRVGMDRLFAMQTLSGGLAYWPGGTQPDAYGSVYAFHFLTMVKNGREIPVPEINYQALKSYVRTVSEDWSQEGASSLYLRAYALYTLALAGDLKSLEQIQRFDEIAIPRASRYLLAAALAMSSHDPDRVSFYLSKTPVSEFNDRELGGTLNSEIRNTAVELMALQQMKADPEEIAKHANTLLTFLERNRHGSTQETAFIATALSGYLTQLGEHIENASVTIETSEGVKSITGTQLYHQTLEGASPTCRVSNTGTTDVYVNLVRHGIPLQPQEEVVQEGLAVERTLLKNNEKYDDVLFQQGDTYIVEIKMTCVSVLENVVVSDLLPAGFEVENSRLDPDQVPDSHLQSAVMPSFLEIRDDKVVCAFNRLEKGEHHFYYIVRAVTPGSYQYPSLVAECMYDPNSKATTLAQRIQIQ
jgi:alpha-2-macroglobulin